MCVFRPSRSLAGPDGLPLTSTGVWWNHLTTKPRGTVGAWTSIRIANHHLPPRGLFPGDAMEPPRWTPEAVEIQSWKIRGPKACNCLIGRPHSLNYSCRPLFPYLAARTDENTNQKKKRVPMYTYMRLHVLTPCWLLKLKTLACDLWFPDLQPLSFHFQPRGRCADPGDHSWVEGVEARFLVSPPIDKL